MHDVVAIVCGGRNYANREHLFTELDRLRDEYDIAEIIHGGAKRWLGDELDGGSWVGADYLAGEWARHHGLTCRCYMADWTQFDMAAGPLRNQYMLDTEKPSLVIAFPGGRGTANMVRRARAAGVRVIEIEEKKRDG